MSENIINNEHDKTYKSFLNNKKSFLELLQSFVDEKWVKLLDEDDLELVNKSFILKDYEDRESDIIYKLKLNNKEGKKEIYFYILLEMQSSNDFTMPFRLLLYMTELWRQLFLNTDKNIRERKEYRLPAVVPLLIYNGDNAWTANMSFKEMQLGYELFGDHLVDFKYILFDVNRYNDNELLQIGNLISTVFLLDKKGDAAQFIDRFKKAMDKIKKLDKDQTVLIKNWLKLILGAKLPEDKKEEFDNMIDHIENMEGDSMVMNLEVTLNEMEAKAEKRSKLEIARKLIKRNLDLELISDSTGLSKEEIEKLIEDMED